MSFILINNQPAQYLVVHSSKTLAFNSRHRFFRLLLQRKIHCRHPMVILRTTFNGIALGDRFYAVSCVGTFLIALQTSSERCTPTYMCVVDRKQKQKNVRHRLLDAPFSSTAHPSVAYVNNSIDGFSAIINAINRRRCSVGRRAQAQPSFAAKQLSCAPDYADTASRSLKSPVLIPN